MVKKFKIILCSFFMLYLSSFQGLLVLANTNLPFELESKSGILMEMKTGEVLYEKNIHEKLPPASVTKIMTLLLIYEGVSNGDFKWEDLVTVSEHASGMGGSQVYLETGETQTVADMTKAIAIASANDGAVAMAEFIGGSEDGFVNKMNEKARELGMENTTFKNACGLDEDGHVTTAYDIALMSRELMGKYPEITQYTTTRLDTIIHSTKRGDEEFGLTNTNKLITSYNGITGLKTGSTSKALYCLSATAKRDDLEFISVVLSAPDNQIRFDEGGKLLDYGFENFTIETGHSAGKIMGEVEIEKGSTESVKFIVKEEISVLIPKDSGANWEVEIDTLPSLKAPLERGSKVGELTYVLDGKTVGKTDLITEKSIEKANLHIILERIIKNWW